MGVGGLVRGRDKKWLGGFMGFVGLGSPLEAELMVVLVALEFTWDKGWRYLILESDCMDVVNIFTTGLGTSFHKFSGLVKTIQDLLARDWMVNFLHVYREANEPADWLAYHGARVVLPVKWLDVPPPDVETMVVIDSISRP
ncbi:Ribonuclease H domain [Sesbania bispinosa]|nr:Ribonuclease H domain [Sesbania bispinosa]